MASSRVWGCPHKGSPALAQGGGAQEGDKAEGSVILSHGLTRIHSITRCYQFPSVFHFIKSLGWWAHEPQSVESLFVLLLWEGVRKAADPGSARLSGLDGAKAL